MLWACLCFLAGCLVTVLIRWCMGGAQDAPQMASVFAAPFATVVGFYTWKARTENKLKIMNATKLSAHEVSTLAGEGTTEDIGG